MSTSLHPISRTPSDSAKTKQGDAAHAATVSPKTAHLMLSDFIGVMISNPALKIHRHPAQHDRKMEVTSSSVSGMNAPSVLPLSPSFATSAGMSDFFAPSSSNVSGIPSSRSQAR